MISRTTEILSAVDNLLEVHDQWEKDTKAPVHPTEAFEQAMEHAIAVGDGDTPAQCRDLCFAINKLGIEWNKYKNGLRTKDHRPVASFWGAFRDVIATRQVAEPREIHQPEPVATLLEQKVTYNQIARHIWGHNGKGPFLSSSGQVLLSKLLEEGKEPGKHTKDWIHPEQLARQRDEQQAYARRIGAIADKEAADTRTIEKATLVEMLKEGQYPDVIARVKGVSLEGVLQEAKRYGITPNMRPNLAATRSDKEPPTVPSDVDTQRSVNSVNPASALNDLANAALEEDNGEIVPQDDDEFGADAEMSDADMIRELNDGTRGTPEIIAAGKASGRKWSSKQVREALAG